MSQQRARQQARRRALDAQTLVRIRRVQQDKRRTLLARQVMQALTERDATVIACEKRAGQALAKLTGAEGLTLREAAQWCGGALTSREAARLRRLGQADVNEVAGGESEPAPNSDPAAAS